MVSTQVLGARKHPSCPPPPAQTQGEGAQICAHLKPPASGLMCAYTPYSKKNNKKKYICIYISSRMHRITRAPISSQGPKHPHRGHLPTWVWGCVAGQRGGPEPPAAPPALPRARSLSLSSSPRSGAQDQARASPPIAGASGRREPPFLGTAWPEPRAAPLPWVSLALEVSPLGFYPGEVEERGGWGVGGGRGAGLQWGRGVSSKK